MFSAMFDLFVLMFAIYSSKDSIQNIWNFKTFELPKKEFKNKDNSIVCSYEWTILPLFFAVVLIVDSLIGWYLMNTNMLLNIVQDNTNISINLGYTVGITLIVLTLIHITLTYGYQLFYKTKKIS